ncbi:MAG: LVIVD repeat-containing protein [Acidimicrobiia bacterium]
MKRMRTKRIIVLIAALSVVLLALPASPAGAGHTTDPKTNNMHPLGHIVEPASLLNASIGNPNIHTDIAFWGKHAFQGSWLGFNIRDISAPGNPKQVSFTPCTGNQGDVVVWENVLVRAWNSPASLGASCDGQLVPAGFEGLHVFDISNLSNPVLVGSVDLSALALPADPPRPTRCGSHTATGVPDLANNRLLIYSSGSGCSGIDIVGVPLANPGNAAFIRWEDSGRLCHDTGVILGDAMMAACAGGDGFTQWTLTGTGSLENPDFVRSVSVPGVTIGHSAAFTWDGEVIVFGHEPGGGVQANCQASNPASDKSAFFFDAVTGAQLGMWTLPRPQSNIENCTIHNFNVVPLKAKKGTPRYVLVSGSYQSGTSVVDFSDPANPVEIAWSDPPAIPAVGGPFCGGLGCEIGGVWSSYWYNNFIYETNITEGLNNFRFSGNETAGALKLDHLNPQTQEFTL